MTTYKLEYTDFEGEKTTLIKELQGDNAWENNIEETLEIMEHFLRAIGYKFDKLDAVTSVQGVDDFMEECHEDMIKDIVKDEKEYYGRNPILEELSKTNPFNKDGIDGSGLISELNAIKGEERMQNSINDSEEAWINHFNKYGETT